MSSKPSSSASKVKSSHPKEIPVFKAWDGFGGALSFKRRQLEFLADGIEKSGDIFRFRPLGTSMVMVNHPDYIRHVLVDAGERYDKNVALYKVVRPILRNGLIANADMKLWFRQRRMMAPHFTPRAVSSFARNMTDETVRMLERWQSGNKVGDTVAVTDEMGQLALRIVNRSMFGADVGESAQAFARAFNVANNVLGAFFRFPFPPLSVPTPSHRRLHRAIDDMDEFVSRFIKERLGKNSAVPARTDLLTLLLRSVDEESGEGMDLEQPEMYLETALIETGQ